MSSYHILNATGKGIRYSLQVEFHIPIPDDTISLTNSLLRTLISNDSEIDKTSTIADGTELTQMTNGEVVKVSKNVSSHQANTNIQMRDKVRERYTELAVSVVDDLKAKYKGKGFNETAGVEF